MAPVGHEGPTAASRARLTIETMSIFQPRSHVFVDESKARDYFVAAATVAPDRTSQVDRDLRKLTRRGQSRIHFKSERDSSRRVLLSRMAGAGLRVQLYVVRGRTDKESRQMCLEALVADLADAGASRLTLERDESLIMADRRIIRDALIAHNYLGMWTYQHAGPADYSALWVSDAAAWCHQAGGEWIARAQPLVGGVTTLG